MPEFVSKDGENGRDYIIDANDLLLDLKVLMKEYYAGTFNAEGTALKVNFKNGQKFLISVIEI